MSYSVLRNEGGHWRFILKSTIEKEVRVINVSRLNGSATIKNRFRDVLKTNIRKNDYKKSRLLSLLELTI